ncbi:hypothetical protein L596_030746 [Steinernema carpocapsae]|uniref:diacylglycerol O-acyltransferase n=1 Tax=Steinernema carpocapsae TaxID=34508 RepID=A0A4U5LNQ0_STECR|nr:hypothetical protein L596_030746 [Steinernema carpocapsae]
MGQKLAAVDCGSVLLTIFLSKSLKPPRFLLVTTTSLAPILMEFSAMEFSVQLEPGFAKLFPGITPSIATLNIQFMLPLRRELNMAVGGISSSKESITYQLNRDKGGRAVVIVLGGAEEALDAHPHSFVLTLKHRMGFAKLALETGAHLVPIYSFGENDVYNQISNERGSWVREIQERIKHIIGFSPVLFNGRGIFNYSFGLLPYRKPINIVFGAPIPVKKVEKPTREQVQELHDQYCDALTKLFDNHKANYGISEDMKLTIL